MNRAALYCTLLFLTVILANAALAGQDGDEGDAPLTHEESATIEFLATVSAIDYESREIQLEDAQGNIRTVTADPRVHRLDEIQVGDLVSGEIVVSVLAEVRPPTPEELADPASVTRGVVRAPGGEAMAGSMSESLTAVVTVVALNLLNETLTVQTPNNNLVDVKAQSVDNLKQLRLGDTIVITYTQSVALSIQKAGTVAPE